MVKNIICSDPRRRQRPICIADFVPLTKGGNSIGERRDRRQKEMRRTCKRNFSNTKGACAKFVRLEPEKEFNGLDQKLYER